MAKTTVCLCGLLGILGTFSASVVGQPADDPPPKWIFKAVAFSEPSQATQTLNWLHRNGWEYVGSLGQNLTAFKRRYVEERELLNGPHAKKLDSLGGAWQLGKPTLRFGGNRWEVLEDGAAVRSGSVQFVGNDASGTWYAMDLHFEKDTSGYAGTVETLKFSTQGTTLLLRPVAGFSHLFPGEKTDNSSYRLGKLK